MADLSGVEDFFSEASLLYETYERSKLFNNLYGDRDLDIEGDDTSGDEGAVSIPAAMTSSPAGMEVWDGDHSAFQPIEAKVSQAQPKEIMAAAAPAVDESLSLPADAAAPPPRTPQQLQLTNTTTTTTTTDEKDLSAYSKSVSPHQDNGNNTNDTTERDTIADSQVAETTTTSTEPTTQSQLTAGNLAQPVSSAIASIYGNYPDLPQPATADRDLQTDLLQPDIQPGSQLDVDLAPFGPLSMSAHLHQRASSFASDPTNRLFPPAHLDDLTNNMMHGFFSPQPIPRIPPPKQSVAPSELSNNYHEYAQDYAQDEDPVAVNVEVANALKSFCALQFADGEFLITTHALTIGRDQRALEQARRNEKRQRHYEKRLIEAQAHGLTPPPPPSHRGNLYSKSYVSEEGGMLGPESDGESERPAKRRKARSGSGEEALVANGKRFRGGEGQVAPPAKRRKVKSASGSQRADGDDVPEETEAHDLSLHRESTRQYVSHISGAAPVDVLALRPPLDYVPRLGIHSPGPDIATKTKAISRTHMRIEWNKSLRAFQAVPIHKNGFFVNDELYCDTRATLRHGDILQVKDVEFIFLNEGDRFCMPQTDSDMEDSDEEADAMEVDDEDYGKRGSKGGKSMSFEFESSHASNARETSEEEEPEAVEISADDDDDSGAHDDEDVEEVDEGDGDGDEEQDIRETVESDENETPTKVKMDASPPTEKPKKRGPGRPPKNGIMSKREERLLKKQQAEAAKKDMPPPPPGEPQVKRKVGRPRKHPLPEDDGERPEKRKYKPRKPKDPDAVGSDGEKVPDKKKSEKHKTPPPDLGKREDYPEEKLQKPTKSYGVLIDEILSDEAPDGLTLKQIYKRIQLRWPYYHFDVETKGWESSVRHNLIGNGAFRKDPQQHKWFRVEGVDLDTGKKRKVTSPDPTQPVQGNMHYAQMPQNQYQPSMVPGAQGYQPQSGGAPRYPAVSAPGQVFNGQPGTQQPYNPSMPGQMTSLQAGGFPPGVPQQGYPNMTQGQPQAHGQGTTSGQAPAYNPAGPPRQPQQGAQPAGYNSPYTQKPMAQPGMPTHTSPPAPAQVPYQPSPAMQRAPATSAPPHGAPPGVHANAAVAGPPIQPSAPPPGVNGVAQPAVELRPAIPPERMTFIQMFKKNAVTQIGTRLNKGEAVAMSVINRGLNLTSQITTPEHHAVENIVHKVFIDSLHQRYTSAADQALYKAAVAQANAAAEAATAAAKAASSEPDKVQPVQPVLPTRQKPHCLDPRLETALLNFKAYWLDTLKKGLDELKADQLLLSAIDRVLKITDGSIMHPANPAEAKELEDAEAQLMRVAEQVVLDFRRTITNEAPN